MASLTETAYYTRRTINWTILGIIAYILLRIFWSLFVTAWLAIFPPKAPPPNFAFQKLPALVFPPQATPSASLGTGGSGQLTFQLETIQGAIPAASPSAAVFFMPKAAANLLALTRTQEFAAQLNFDATPIGESKNIYRFNDPDFPLRRLRYDIVSGNFILRYAFERDTGVFAEKDLSTEETAKRDAINLLENHNLYTEDLQNGTIHVTFLRLMGEQLVPTTSLSQSDAVRVDFFRAPVANSPVLTDNPNEGHVSIIYSGSSDARKRLIQFVYTYWPIDYETTGTYALKTGAQAWEELQQGQGFIARAPHTGTTAIVRNIYLGYYDSFDPQTYLQPIFVFEGDYGFLGYIPAVVPEWVEEAN